MPEERAGRSVTGMPRSHALTDREQQVLALVAAGRTNREIGAALSITAGSVKGHLRRIYRKLGVARKGGSPLFSIESWRRAPNHRPMPAASPESYVPLRKEHVP